MQPQQPKKKSALRRAAGAIKNKIAGAPDPMDRIDNANVIFKEYGLIPVLNIRDLEQRRKEIGSILNEIEGRTLSGDMKKEVVEKVFRLFFMSGSAWFRGIDNPGLSHAVTSYLSLYKRVGQLPHSPPHLFVCAMNLLHYSFNALDVTNTPVYMMHVMQPMNNHQQLPYGYGPSQNPQNTDAQQQG
jgi:hypothetical protein